LRARYPVACRRTRRYLLTVRTDGETDDLPGTPGLAWPVVTVQVVTRQVVRGNRFILIQDPHDSGHFQSLPRYVLRVLAIVTAPNQKRIRPGDVGECKELVASRPITAEI
jgi:hypothetical protein